MNEITILKPKDIRNIISEVVEEKLIAFSKWFEAKLIQEDKPLTPKEAMEYLSMSKTTFYRYIKNGKIPQYGLDQKRYFKQSDLDNAIRRIN